MLLLSLLTYQKSVSDVTYQTEFKACVRLSLAQFGLTSCWKHLEVLNPVNESLQCWLWQKLLLYNCELFAVNTSSRLFSSTRPSSVSIAVIHLATQNRYFSFWLLRSFLNPFVACWLWVQYFWDGPEPKKHLMSCLITAPITGCCR